MDGYLLRFLGRSKPPDGLTQQDIDEAFSLSTEDVRAITDGRTFVGRFRLGVGLQVVMLRATGRTMDTLVGVPRPLLQSLCRALGRPATLSAHLDWVRRHTGFRNADAIALAELEAALVEGARMTPSVRIPRDPGRRSAVMADSIPP